MHGWIDGWMHECTDAPMDVLAHLDASRKAAGVGVGNMVYLYTKLCNVVS